MQIIELNAQVTEERVITAHLPDHIPPGEYEVLIVLNSISKANLAVRNSQLLLRQYVSEGRELALELIQERREESQYE